MAGRLTLPLALLVLSLAAIGCGGDDETATTGATGASGADSATAAFDDADAKAAARAAQVSLEVYATENNGSYAGADPAGLGAIEPSLADADLTVTADTAGYEIEVASPSGALFSIARTADGAVELTCEPTGTSACPNNGDWG